MSGLERTFARFVPPRNRPTSWPSSRRASERHPMEFRRGPAGATGSSANPCPTGRLAQTSHGCELVLESSAGRLGHPVEGCGLGDLEDDLGDFLVVEALPEA